MQVLRWKTPYVIIVLTFMLFYALVELWNKGQLPSFSVRADRVGFLIMVAAGAVIVACLMHIFANLLLSKSMVPVVIPLMLGIILLIVATSMPVSKQPIPATGVNTSGFISLGKIGENDIHIQALKNQVNSKSFFFTVNLESKVSDFISDHFFAPLLASHSPAEARSACYSQGGEKLISLADPYYLCYRDWLTIR
jgi:hypothetical protein